MPIGPIVPGDPTTITPDVNPPLYTSIQGPSPTEPVIAQDILDLTLVVMNVQAAVNRPATDNTKRWLVAAQTVSRWQRNTFVSKMRSGVPDWETNDRATIQQANITDSDNACTIMLDLPDQAVISSVFVQFLAAGGHGVFPIAGFHLPTIILYKKNPITNVDTPLGTKVDPSATAGDYQTSHVIEIDALAETI